MRIKGFTLVELMVVIAILGILIVISIFVLNPRAQITKVTDAARKRDIQQIKTALDMYYNDYNCYPSTLPFGSVWKQNSVVYMSKLPLDTTCGNNQNCYTYFANGSCSQWSVIFTKLSTVSSPDDCSLNQLTSCLPLDYDSSWSCVVRGNVDTAGCSYVSSNYLLPIIINAGNTATPTQSSASDTETCSKDYVCGASGACNRQGPNLGVYCTANCDGQCTKN